MVNKKVYAIVILLFFSLYGVYSQHYIEPGYEDIPWGSALETVKTKYASAPVEECTGYAGVDDNDTLYMGAQDGSSVINSRYYYFYKNRLYKVVCKYNKGKLDDIKDFLKNLEKWYGKNYKQQVSKTKPDQQPATILKYTWENANRTKVIMTNILPGNGEEQTTVVYQGLDEISENQFLFLQ